MIDKKSAMILAWWGCCDIHRAYSTMPDTDQLALDLGTCDPGAFALCYLTQCVLSENHPDGECGHHFPAHCS